MPSWLTTKNRFSKIFLFHCALNCVSYPIFLFIGFTPTLRWVKWRFFSVKKEKKKVGDRGVNVWPGESVSWISCHHFVLGRLHHFEPGSKKQFSLSVGWEDFSHKFTEMTKRDNMTNRHNAGGQTARTALSKLTCTHIDGRKQTARRKV